MTVSSTKNVNTSSQQYPKPILNISDSVRMQIIFQTKFKINKYRLLLQYKRDFELLQKCLR